MAPLDSDDTRVLAAALVRLGATVVAGRSAWEVDGTPARDRGAKRRSSTSVRPGPPPVSSSRSCPPCRAASCSTAARGCGSGRWARSSRRSGLAARGSRRSASKVSCLFGSKGGRLTGGEVSIRADVSSQFVSALLLASPVVAGGLVRPDRGATGFGRLRRADAARPRGVRPGGCLSPGPVRRARGRLGGLLPDRRCSRVRRARRGSKGSIRNPPSRTRSSVGGRSRPGAALRWEGKGEDAVLVVEGGAAGSVEALDADVDPAPDAALPLAALVAFALGTSRLRGVARLREKESDRLSAALDLLARSGASARTEGPEGEPVSRHRRLRGTSPSGRRSPRRTTTGWRWRRPSSRSRSRPVARSTRPGSSRSRIPASGRTGRPSSFPGEVTPSGGTVRAVCRAKISAAFGE